MSILFTDSNLSAKFNTDLHVVDNVLNSGSKHTLLSLFDVNEYKKTL